MRARTLVSIINCSLARNCYVIYNIVISIDYCEITYIMYNKYLLFMIEDIIH